MKPRFTALLAVSLLCLAALGHLVEQSLSAFEPCRILYRTHQAVQDSSTCKVFATLVTAELLFVLLSQVVTICAAAQSLRARGTHAANRS